MKLQQMIEQVNTQGKKAFIPYVMAGDGGLHHLAPTILKFQQLGATAIEVGIPFTDPVADGPVIEDAGNRALKNGVTLSKVIEALRQFKDARTIPVIVMTYLNPILAYGIEEFAEAAASAGIQAVIIPDMPLEERNTVYPALLANDIDLIQLVSLTSTTERQKQLVEASEGFVYAVTVNGITGERQTFEQSLAAHFNTLKSISPLPVIAGFGISTREHIETFSHFSDGVIVGSKIVQALHENDWASIEYLLASPQIV
jgi:tryptophan synthase alpha chain